MVKAVKRVKPLRYKPGNRVAIVGSSKYAGLAGTVSQVNVNQSGSITYFVALDKPLEEDGHLILEIRARSDHVQVVQRERSAGSLGAIDQSHCRDT